VARIVISTIGVRGDLNPFIAIGKGLQARGHDVAFALEPALQTAVADEGFPFEQLTGDVLHALSPHLSTIVGGLTPIGSVRTIARNWLTVELAAKVKDLEAACAGADLLIARAAHLAAPIAAERLGIPWVQVTMTALTIPSAHADPGLIPLRAGRAPRPANRAAWAAIEFVTRRLADGRVNDLRRELGLPPTRNAMGRGGHSRHLTAVAISPLVSRHQPDWPTYVTTTGYCFWDVPSAWHSPKQLTTFLAGPDPVVAVSFGSIAPFAGGVLSPLYETAVGAVLACGARALVVGADRETSTLASDGRVLGIPFAPFSQVYPRCAAAIHHGGPYTAGEALRAGIPSLAVPWGIDQFFTAAQLQRTGAGWARHHRRFSDVVARRDVEALFMDGRLRRCAKTMAARIAVEDGVGTLCDAVESVLQRSVQPSRT
jgi:UDP:flavonoid glycosyltransferase YjiC (YdhE family)